MSTMTELFHGSFISTPNVIIYLYICTNLCFIFKFNLFFVIFIRGRLSALSLKV